MAKSLPVLVVLSLASFVIARRVDMLAPDEDNMMSKAEAKQILGERMLSELEEIGTKEVLREHGMEDISEKDAQRIVTAAEGIVQESQMMGGQTISDKEAQNVLGKYDEKLQEIGAGKMLSDLEDIGAKEVLRENGMQDISEDDARGIVNAAEGMVEKDQMLGGKTISDSEAQNILSHYEEQLQEIGAAKVLSVAPTMAQMNPSHSNFQVLNEGKFTKSEVQQIGSQHVKMVQESEARRLVKPEKKMSHESRPFVSMMQERLQEGDIHHVPSPRKKMSQNLGTEEIIGHAKYPFFGSNAHKIITNFKPEQDHHQKGYHHEEQAGKAVDRQAQGVHAEGVFQRTKHHLAHMLHLDGSQAHANPIRTNVVSDDDRMVNEMLRDIGVQIPGESIHWTQLTHDDYKKSQGGNEKMITDIGAKKIVSAPMNKASDSNAPDHHGFQKKIMDFGQVVHNFGSEKSKALYLDLLNSLSENQAQVDSQTQSANYRFEVPPAPAPASLFASSFLQVEQTAHKAHNTSKALINKTQSHQLSAGSEVVSTFTSSDAKSKSKPLVEKETSLYQANSTSKVFTYTMDERVLSGRSNVTGKSSSSDANFLNLTMKSLYEANGTNLTHVHAVNGSDVAGTSSSSGAKSLHMKMKSLHEANGTNLSHSHAVNSSHNVGKQHSKKHHHHHHRKAEKNVEKPIHMHHTEMK